MPHISFAVSKYGNRNVTTRTNDLLNPRLLAASTSNEDEKIEMKKILDDLSNRERGIQQEVRHWYSSCTHVPGHINSNYHVISDH